MKKQLSVMIVYLFVFVSNIAFGASVTTFTRPGYAEVNAVGISGNKIVGYHENSQGFIYDISTGTWENFAPGGRMTAKPLGIDGNIIAGVYEGMGFYYNTSTTTFTSFNTGLPTQITGVSGSKITGFYGPTNDTRFFTYDVIDPNQFNDQITQGVFPGLSTRAWDIDGNIIVGEVGNSGFIFNWYEGLTPQIIMYPGSTLTSVQGISGNNLSGFYTTGLDTHGFLYDMVADEWETIPNDPSSTWMQAMKIDGETVVGSIQNPNTVGFIYTVPEPSVFSFFTILLFSIFYRKR